VREILLILAAERALRLLRQGSACSAGGRGHDNGMLWQNEVSCLTRPNC
jgi:hypothetical protein